MKKQLLIAAAALGLLYAVSCTPEYNPSENASLQIELIDSYRIEVPEASGLTYDSTTNTLLTVSDGHRDMVYRMTTDGVVLDSIHLGYEDMDLEGICISSDGNSFWVAEEGARNIVEYDFSGRMLRQLHVDFTGSENSGLEGVAVDFQDSIIYTVNEKNPIVLFKLGFDGNILAQSGISIVGDMSGLAVAADSLPFKLWAVSDQSGMIVTFDENLVPTGIEAPLNFQDAEGIAVKGDTIFIVTDNNMPTSELYRFKIVKIQAGG